METTDKALIILCKEFGSDNVSVLSSSAYSLSVKLYLEKIFVLTYNPYDEECYVTNGSHKDVLFHSLEDAIDFININLSELRLNRRFYDNICVQRF